MSTTVPRSRPTTNALPRDMTPHVLEKLVRASREASQRVRKLDDPFARDLANDLEKLSADMARQLDEARSAARL